MSDRFKQEISATTAKIGFQLPFLIIHATVYFIKGFYLALGIPTARADEAPFLVDQHITAFRALPG